MKRISIYLIIFILTFTFVNAQNNNPLPIENLRQQITINTDDLNLQAPPKLEKKKTGLAVLYSLLLPGMGELYGGDYSSGKYFTITEGALWATYAGMNIYGINQKNNYKSYAQSVGGVNPNGKNDRFWADISGYIDVDQYNREQELNRDFKKVYTTSTHFWDWKNNSNRQEYRSMWKNSEQALNNVRFVVWGMLINRVISAVNAVRVVVKHNKSLEQEMSWNVSVGVFQNPNLPSGMQLNYMLKL